MAERLAAAQGAFHAVADAWMKLQWLKHGPAREDDRSRRLDYWPDPRDSVAKQLARLLADPRDDLLEPSTLAGASAALQGLPDACGLAPEGSAGRFRISDGYGGLTSYDAATGRAEPIARLPLAFDNHLTVA